MPRPKKIASEKAMDYLALRDHSELELRKKLQLKEYSSKEIDTAIAYVKERGWLLDPNVLAKKVTINLQAKGKGSLYIRNYLQRKGLPFLSVDIEEEYAKALHIVQQKLGLSFPFQYDEQAKISRFLKNRGYSMACIRKVLYEGK